MVVLAILLKQKSPLRNTGAKALAFFRARGGGHNAPVYNFIRWALNTGFPIILLPLYLWTSAANLENLENFLLRTAAVEGARFLSERIFRFISSLESSMSLNLSHRKAKVVARSTTTALQGSLAHKVFFGYFLAALF